MEDKLNPKLLYAIEFKKEKKVGLLNLTNFLCFDCDKPVVVHEFYKQKDYYEIRYHCPSCNPFWDKKKVITMKCRIVEEKELDDMIFVKYKEILSNKDFMINKTLNVIQIKFDGNIDREDNCFLRNIAKRRYSTFVL